MQELTLSIKKDAERQNVYVVQFEGAFDGHKKEAVANLEQLIQKETGLKLIFDFEKLSLLNSYAIGQIVAWYNHLLGAGGEILIAHPIKNVEDIFNIVGVSKMIKIFPDVESALKTL